MSIYTDPSADLCFLPLNRTKAARERSAIMDALCELEEGSTLTVKAVIDRAQENGVHWRIADPEWSLPYKYGDPYRFKELPVALGLTEEMVYSYVWFAIADKANRDRTTKLGLWRIHLPDLCVERLRDEHDVAVAPVAPGASVS